MQLADDFKLEGKHHTPAEALALADALEREIGELLAGQRKPGQLSSGLLVDAVQAIRDHIRMEG